MLTERRIRVAPWLNTMNSACELRGLRHGADGMDGMARFFRIDDAGLGDAGEGGLNRRFEFGTRRSGRQKFLRHRGRERTAGTVACGARMGGATVPG